MLLFFFFLIIFDLKVHKALREELGFLSPKSLNALRINDAD